MKQLESLNFVHEVLSLNLLKAKDALARLYDCLCPFICSRNAFPAVVSVQNSKGYLSTLNTHLETLRISPHLQKRSAQKDHHLVFHVEITRSRRTWLYILILMAWRLVEGGRRTDVLMWPKVTRGTARVWGLHGASWRSGRFHRNSSLPSYLSYAVSSYVAT